MSGETETTEPSATAPAPAPAPEPVTLTPSEPVGDDDAIAVSLADLDAVDRAHRETAARLASRLDAVERGTHRARIAAAATPARPEEPRRRGWVLPVIAGVVLGALALVGYAARKAVTHE